MEEWRHCVSYLELAEKQWRERLLPANNVKNILSQNDICLVNGEIQDIRQFMQTQPWKCQTKQFSITKFIYWFNFSCWPVYSWNQKFCTKNTSVKCW